MNCPQCGYAVQPGEKFCRSCGAALPDNAPADSAEPTAASASTSPVAGIPTAPVVAAAPQYAGFWLRVVAAIIDGIIVQFGLRIVLAPFGLFTAFSAALVGNAEEPDLAAVGMLLGSVFALFVVSLVAQWFYYAFFESSKLQATPGKRVLGIVVTDLSGARISFGRATGRYWGKVVSGLILGIGYLMAAWTEKKQALHDTMAHTLVLRP